MSPLPALPNSGRRVGKGTAAACAGFSLAELMVGLSLGLLTLLAMSQVYVAFHVQHRGTDSDIGAQTSAMNALYAIERDLLQAGHGLGDRRLLGCTGRRDGGASMALVPAQITAGANGAPDTLQLLLGESRAPPAAMSAALAPGGTVLAVGSTLGMRAGDTLALQQDGLPCALVRIASVDSPLQASRVLGDGNAPQGETDAVGSGGHGAGAIAFNLGQLAQVSYALGGAMLQRTRTAYPGAEPVTENNASGIVSLRLQYGFDTRSGEQSRLQVDRWSVTMLDADQSGISGDRGDWQRMAALKLAVVARSPFRQAPGAGGACSATTAANAPGWETAKADGSRGRSAISLAHVPDWQCYRYRVAETVVPLRNVLWGAH
nr:PilW family protein [uncultured Noviherbaspirillum sp.]